MKCKDQTSRISKGIPASLPCGNEAWKDGYCKVHHPDEQKSREKKHWDRWAKKLEQDRIDTAKCVAGKDYVAARKAAGLLTIAEAKALGAKI